MLELKTLDDSREVTLQFEHSLLSLSKWESKYKKPFMSTDAKLSTEMIEYFKDMLLTPDVDKNLVLTLSPKHLDELANYINDTRSASSVPPSGERSYEVVTSELIYYWMVGLQIPFEAETWHLSRLLMLIQITNFKNQPPKKRNPIEVMTDWRAENERRRKMFQSNG